MQALAFAKVNLSLRVRAAGPEGLHPVLGLFQSVDWADTLTLEPSEHDELTGPEGAEVVDGWENLAWRAVTLVRDTAASGTSLRLELGKLIPVAAGLAGGSADAAAGLGLAGRRFAVPDAELLGLAAELGSDVPFCFSGGLAMVSGTGEKVDTREPSAPFGMALVVPPIELSTRAVYAAWDRLGGPSGPEMAGRDLPPGLRDEGPLANDLYAAAVAVAPDVDEWRAELALAWGRPVALTGSGPTLFAYFVDEGEAEDGLGNVPLGARAAQAVTPVPYGWQFI